MTLPSFTSSRPSAQTTPQKCREQSESARRPSEFLCRISLGQSAIWLKFCVFILCTKICRAYPKEFIESASFAAAAGASAHANAQHGVPVRRRSNSIGTFADLFFMLFSIISMPFWRDWSANGVGSAAGSRAHSLEMLCAGPCLWRAREPFRAQICRNSLFYGQSHTVLRAPPRSRCTRDDAASHSAFGCKCAVGLATPAQRKITQCAS